MIMRLVGARAADGWYEVVHLIITQHFLDGHFVILFFIAHPRQMRNICGDCCGGTLAYLECITEFVAHYAVEQWIDTSGQEVQHAGNIGEHRVNFEEPSAAFLCCLAVYSHDALCMEWRPAEAECHGYGNCRTLHKKKEKT